MGDGPKRTGPGQPLPLRALLQKWSECVPSGSTRPDLDREFLSLTVSCGPWLGAGPRRAIRRSGGIFALVLFGISAVSGNFVQLR